MSKVRTEFEKAMGYEHLSQSAKEHLDSRMWPTWVTAWTTASASAEMLADVKVFVSNVEYELQNISEEFTPAELRKHIEIIEAALWYK